jgi:hypothetical protein
VLLTQLQGLADDGLAEVTGEERGATTFRRDVLTALGESLLVALDPAVAWGTERLRAHGQEWSPPVAPSAPVR